jgi:hypothetical protein
VSPLRVALLGAGIWLLFMAVMLAHHNWKRRGGEPHWNKKYLGKTYDGQNTWINVGHDDSKDHK